MTFENNTNDPLNLDLLLDLNNVDSSETVYSKIQPGEYYARVDSVITGTNNRGVQYIMVKFEIIQEPHCGWKISKFFNCWHEKLEVAKRSQIELKRIFEILGGQTNDSNSIVGKECLITVEHSEWGGKVREEIAEIQPASAAGSMPAAPVAPKTTETDDIPF